MANYLNEKEYSCPDFFFFFQFSLLPELFFFNFHLWQSVDHAILTP